MRTKDSILVEADIDKVFDVAADVERWPEILPHYRWVKVLDVYSGNPKVEMAARRGWIPVKWTAVQTVRPAKYCIRYVHTGGPTRGMKVEWRLKKEGRSVRITIVHDLTLDAPIVRSVIGQWVVGNIFVHYIATQTLHRMKELLERR